MERDWFVFYKSFYRAIQKIQDKEERLKAYESIVAYGIMWQEPDEDDWDAWMVFILVQPQIDANNKKYADWCKWWRPKKDWDISQKPLVSEKITTGIENKKPKEKDKEKEKEKEKEKGCGGKQDTQLSLDAFASRSEEKETVGNKKVCDVGSIIHKDCETQEQREAIDEAWNAYKEMRKKIKKPLTEYAEKLRAWDLIRLGRTVDERIAILNQSTASWWQDLYELKPKQSSAVPRVSGNLLH